MTASRDFGADGALRAQKLTALALAAASWGAGRAPLELPPRTPAAGAVDELFGHRKPNLWYEHSRAAIIARVLLGLRVAGAPY